MDKEKKKKANEIIYHIKLLSEQYMSIIDHDDDDLTKHLFLVIGEEGIVSDKGEEEIHVYSVIAGHKMPMMESIKAALLRIKDIDGGNNNKVINIQ